MKMKCDSCGKKEVVLMSKAEIKLGDGFVSDSAISKALSIVEDLFSLKYSVCTACGYTKKS